MRMQVILGFPASRKAWERGQGLSAWDHLTHPQILNLLLSDPKFTLEREREGGKERERFASIGILHSMKAMGRRVLLGLYTN